MINYLRYTGFFPFLVFGIFLIPFTLMILVLLAFVFTVMGLATLIERMFR